MPSPSSRDRPGHIAGASPVTRTAKLLAAFAVLISPAAAAQEAGGPVDRLRELVAVMNAADPARARSFVRSAFAKDFLAVAPEDEHVGFLLAESRGTAGRFELVGAEAINPTAARGAVRNRLTEEIDSVFVRTEPAAPFRISGIGGRPGAGGPIVPETARTDQERVQELDRLVRRLADADAFSGVVLLARDGVPLYFEAFGIANRDFDVAVTRDTRFNLGSANKNMTAVMIGQLVEERKLAWDDPLSKFLPDFPDSAAAHRITIRHLLTHTSGLGSYFNERYREGNPARWRTVDDFLALARPDSMRFEPGTRWAYSNTGYMVLGKVIEVVTGTDWYAATRERIYRRAGMTDSDCYEMDGVNRKLATGYLREWTATEPAWRTNLFMHVVKGGPAGGGWSTAADMLRYSEALKAGRLVSRETLALMRSPKPELSSPRYGYGFALFEGPDVWGHGGDFPGIDFDWNSYGDSGYTLVVMANYNRVNDPIKRKVTRLVRGG